MAPPSDFTPPGGSGPYDPPPGEQPPNVTPPASSPYGPPPGGQPPYDPYQQPAPQPGYPPPYDPYQQPGQPQPGYQQPYPAQPGAYPYQQPAPGYPGSEPPPFQQPAYQQPYYAGYPSMLPKHPSSSTALILGIVGLVGGFFCGLPILASPFAWYVGSQAVREIDGQPGRWDGRDQAKAGQVLGIIGTILLALGVAFFLFFFVLLAASSNG